MNQNKTILWICSLMFLGMTLLSFVDIFIYKTPFSNINILSSLFVKKTPQVAIKKVAKISKPLFEQYTEAHRLIRFEDSQAVALPKFQAKLFELKKGKRRKIRIAWFGDSMIEADLITQTIRKILQEFAEKQYGVGFVPIQSVSSNMRITARSKTEGPWEKKSFENSKDALFLSGNIFASEYGNFYTNDNTLGDSIQILEKWLLCGDTDKILNLKINKKDCTFTKKGNTFEAILLEKSTKKNIDIVWNQKQNNIYGVSIEPSYGIILDNYSYRGITGVELNKVNSKLLQDIAENQYYDLIVLQYGVNMLFRPNDTNYDYYEQMMQPVLEKYKKNLPNTEFLIISCADRAFRYNNEWKTAIGIDSLVKLQANLAFKNQMAFYNLYQSIGGNGTIVKWANSSPKWANKDYIHPNHIGAEAIGKWIAEAFLKDYNLFEKEENKRLHHKK
jgi:lysophospholipase L1-like esterase